ncbi:MAG: tetratricopeptide repeat protein [Bacteroidaceae bacterium]|nr:tetratricopeptide repeat protein [Bacteroidaceae bacterium]MBQ5816821.1 tetratricopeptide repeat protein [Bacteroidaceae bacterium]
MKKTLILLLLSGLGFSAQAADGLTSEKQSALIKECTRLHNGRNYKTALTLLDKIDENSLNSAQLQEVSYLKATTTFAIDHLQGRGLILEHLDNYPESAKREILSALVAESYYFSHDFEKSVEWFAKADVHRLEADERDRADLYKALAMQECGQSEQAIAILSRLRQTSKKYESDAIFHLAAIDYYNDRLDSAYEGFKAVELDDKYHLDVPYYLASIYIKKGEYVRAEKLARMFLEHNGSLPQALPMQQALGAALFGQKRYKEAIAPLKKYIDEYEKPQRIAYYQLGLSYFQTGRYKEAVTPLGMSTGKSDAITQNAYLHMGIIELNFNDLTKARLAFEQAANTNYDSRIREEALYNYALCIHQTRYSPFAESVTVFERFLNEYPNSPHATQVSQYLVEVYMNTRNYDVALRSIEKIRRPSRAILEAKQKVLYRLGVQAFIDKDLKGSINFMDRSIELSSYNQQTHNDALYWRGEAYYALNDYASAANSYKAAVSVRGNNSTNALYGLGYTYFQTEKYGEAMTHFNRFLQQAPASEKALRSDAYNRIGDCHFYNRSYATAEQYYRKAAETDDSQGDYALYRGAITQGLGKDYAGKVETLKRLINNFPQSTYAEQAFYEMGRAYVEQERYEQAIASFDELVKRYPSSSLARKAATETAMIYNQTGNNDKAIAAYKKIIATYPQSDEAQIAAQDLKNIYVDLGKVDEFAEFAANTPGMRAVESSERDTLTYVAAEKIYSRGEIAQAKGAFQKYLQSYPQGSFTLDAHYYLGIIFYNQQAPADAQLHFGKVIAFPDNKYSEDAMALSSELYYKAGSYREAMNLYKQLIAKTSNNERRQACRMNLLRCAYNLNEGSEVLAVAGELLAAGNLSPEWTREVYYDRAKTLIRENKANEAIADLKKLAADTRTQQGAEAKYMLAQIYFNNKKYDDCEKEVLNYIEVSTPHAYWLARSFVLLADLYITLDRKMEAKQYLLSLQNNYTGNDDIAGRIKERLDKLAAEENQIVTQQ